MFADSGAVESQPRNEIPTTSTGNPHHNHKNGLLSSSSLVQVAPLPLTSDFHAGKVMGLGASPPLATQEREEAYIPVALARAQLSKVVADMHAMKAEQVQKLGEILDHYRSIEKDTRERHETRVKALKERAESKLKQSREQFVQLEKAGEIREEVYKKEKKELQDEQETQRLNHLKAHETWRIEFECALQAHEDAFSREQSAALHEIERVSRVSSCTEQHVLQHLQHELEMCTEDAYSLAMRVNEQLRCVRMDVETQHQAFLEREAKLRSHFAATLEVERFLDALLDVVIDKKQQEAEEKRAWKLQIQLRELEEKAKAADSREETLKRRLKAARERFEVIEAQAVEETLELLVHAVVVTMESKVPVETSDTPTQTLTLEVQTIEVVEVPTVVPELVLDKTKYESEVEVSREMNVALIRSKTALHEAKKSLETLTKAKKAVKAEVKTWLSAFQYQHGREPTIEDKAQVKDKYLAFKEAEKAFSTQKALVLTLKQQHRELALRIDASSRWSALGAAVVKSPRTERRVEEREAPNLSSRSSHSETNSSSALQFIETKDNSTDAATGFQNEAVANLEKELQELRSQLASNNSILQLQNVREEEQRVQSVEIIETAVKTQAQVSEELKYLLEEKEKVSLSAQLEIEQVKREAEKVSAVNKQLKKQVKARKEELEQQNQQRQSLQEEIITLSSEIEERRVEKTRLDAEIEQLKLHLELLDSKTLNASEPKSEDEIASANYGENLEAKAVEVENTIDQEQNDDYEEEFEAEAKDDEPEEEELEEEETEEEESEQIKEDAARSLHLVQIINDAVVRGKTQFNRGDKAKCFQTYAKCAEKCLAELQFLHEKRRRQESVALKRVLVESARLPPARGPQTLRKQLDLVRESCEQWLNTREQVAATRLSERNARKEVKAAAKAMRKQQILEMKQKKEEESKKAHKKKSSPPPNTTKGGKSVEETKQKLRALEIKAKTDRMKISQLEEALVKSETQLISGTSSSSGTGLAASDRRVVEMEKKHKKALEDSEKAAKKEISALHQQLQSAQKASQELQDQAVTLQKEVGVAGGRAKQLDQLEVQVTQLREQAALVAPLTSDLRDVKAQFVTLETSYREEQTLRKKYYNQIEDMKGKIRVYARCRPMSSSENERGCAPCVKFVDEFSMEISGGNRAAKTFAYDQVFSPASTQIQVFEDTKNLLQSAVDGYNVCIFAYGQTGSGKTFTMTGVDRDPGLSPRTIHHLFALAEEAKPNFTINFQATMLELYNDSLIDLFHLMDGGGAHDTKLEIKKNEKGMVVVQNATFKKCTSPEQTLRFFEAANKKRQVGATKMNAESSRSHSIFSLLVESYNKTTKATTIGKLSLVDLAGSERAGKTGATADRLKEAQAINKSLSALGDVISALSTNEKFIPYRNNKLTQLMQDSLGGNAKTLMFVNISPADYNQEETVTSLTYASRVKLITNNANKNSESEQVNRLKAIIKQLRAGKVDVDLEGVLD